MGLVRDSRSQSDEEQGQQAPSTLETSVQPGGNAAMQEDVGFGSGASAAGGWADWYRDGGLGQPLEGGDWTFAVEDENGFVSRDRDARVRLGSTILLTCDLGGASAAEVALDLAHAGFDVGPLTMVGSLATLMLFPTEVGRHRIDLDASVNEGPEARHFTFGTAVSVEMDPTQFTARLVTAQAIVSQSYMKLSTAMMRMGAAYGRAYAMHSGALKAAGDKEALAGRFLWDTAFDLVGGGVATALTANLAAGKVVADGAKALVKLGFKTAGKQMPDFTRPLFGALPMEPESIEKALEIRMNEEMTAVLGVLITWSELAASEDPDFLLDFEPDKAIRQELTVMGQTIDEFYPKVAPDPTEAALQLETGMWAGWLEAHAYELIDHGMGPPTGTHEDRWGVRDNVNGPIEARIVELLPDRAAAFIERHAAVARERAEEEAARRNEAPMIPPPPMRDDAGVP